MEEKAARKAMTQEEAVRFLRDYIQIPGKNQTKVAQELGYSTGTVSGFLSGKYPAPANVLRSVEELAAMAEQKSVAPMEPPYQETGISRMVCNAIKYSHLQGKISVVYGDAGIGKTMAFRHYLAENSLAIGITLSPTYASITGVNELVAEQLGVRERVSRKITAEIVSKLRGSGRVVAVDEAQHLTVRALNHLRCIGDESGVGICLIGNDEVYTKMKGSGRADFAQLFSRIGMRRQVLVSHISHLDVEQVFSKYVADREAVEILYKICRTNYGLRGAVNVFINTAAVFQEITAQGLSKMIREMNIGQGAG